MSSNLHLKKIELKVRRCGSQPSICVRTFTSFTNSFPASINKYIILSNFASTQQMYLVHNF